MTTHIAVTQRALAQSVLDKEFHRILLEYPNYLQAGSYFPDCIYLFLETYVLYPGGYFSSNEILKTASEMAHWPDFWNQTVLYIHETYPRPYSEKAKQLIAFLFGMTSHGVADASWHSLNGKEGFLEALKEISFGGDYSRAHQLADAGGEFMLAHSSPLQYLSLIWHVPTTDLIQIYGRMNVSGMSFYILRLFANPLVSARQINLSMIAGNLGMLGVKLFGNYLFNVFAAPSSFFTREYESYFKGGVQDMSSLVVECWNYLVRWLVNGTQHHFCKSVDFEWSPKDSFHGVQSLQKSFTIKVHVQNVLDMLWASTLTDSVSNSPKKDESRFKYQKTTLDSFLQSMQDFIWSVYLRFKSRMGYPHCQTMSFKGLVELKGSNAYDGLGKSMVFGDFDGDGHKEWAVSAPFASSTHSLQSGVVYIVKEYPRKSGRIMDLAQSVLSCNSSSGRFGHAMTVVDFNKDGIDDLVVSAPSLGGLDLEYRGVVYVYFGSKLGPLGNVPNVILQPKSRKKLHIPGSKWDSDVIELGEYLHAHDLDGDGYKDLLIASPRSSFHSQESQKGSVHAFLSRSYHSGTLFIESADWILTGSQNYEWFGHSLDIWDSMLYIGAPGHSSGAGVVYQYHLENGQPLQTGNWSSFRPNSQFGSFVKILSEDSVLVGSPSESHSQVTPQLSLFPALWVNPSLKGRYAGAIRVYNTTSESFIFEGLGLSTFGFLGNEHAFSFGKNLWISEPFAFLETGAVYRIENFMDAWNVSTRVLKCLVGKHSKERFGSTFAYLNVGQGEYLFSSSRGGDDSGTVFMYTL